MVLSVTVVSSDVSEHLIPSWRFVQVSALALSRALHLYNRPEKFFDGDLGTLIDLLLDKVSTYRVSLTPLPDRIDGPWSSVRQERDYQEVDAGKTFCTCNSTSMEAVSD
jgi:hypothetical protein